MAITAFLSWWVPSIWSFKSRKSISWEVPYILVKSIEVMAYSETKLNTKINHMEREFMQILSTLEILLCTKRMKTTMPFFISMCMSHICTGMSYSILYCFRLELIQWWNVENTGESNCCALSWIICSISGSSGPPITTCNWNDINTAVQICGKFRITVW